ncbi:hypothetical protein GGR56DRAFT_619085 [Xylariaceae sp. FL0804]|nr:hypothetical protein GGR56DRAFT_619085 [Xylariaceae sp. FL0804]
MVANTGREIALEFLQASSVAFSFPPTSNIHHTFDFPPIANSPGSFRVFDPYISAAALPLVSTNLSTTMESTSENWFKYMQSSSCLNPALTSCSFPRQPMTMVEVVLVDGQRYHCYAEVLMHHADFFKACLKNGWREAQTKELHLVGDDPKGVIFPNAFPLFMEWTLSNQQLRFTDSEPVEESWEFTEVPSTEDTKPTWKEAVDLWLLADYLVVPKLQNYLIRLMSSKLQRKKFPPPQLLRHVWSATAEGSKLRNFILAILRNPRHCRLDPQQFTQKYMTGEMALEFGRLLWQDREALYSAQDGFRRSKISKPMASYNKQQR